MSSVESVVDLRVVVVVVIGLPVSDNKISINEGDMILYRGQTVFSTDRDLDVHECCIYVRFRRGRKFVVLVVGGRAAS